MGNEKITKALSGSYKNSDGRHDEYYVYMLCEKKTKTPFYIGKGINSRIYAHEDEASKLEKQIEEDIKCEIKANWDNLPKEQLNSMILNKMKSEKLKEISNRIKKKDFEAVIIKYGLTQNEAYMAESALINMHNYTRKEAPLTNIVNGHMSNREKFNRARKTVALNLTDFDRECAIEEVKSPLSTKLKVAFIKINAFYPYCKDEQDIETAIYNATQGFWRIAEDRLCKIEYIFALYQSQIVGIYPVNKSCWKKRKEIKKTFNEKGAIYGDDVLLPSFPIEMRTKEYYWINKSIQANWDYNKFKLLVKANELEDFMETQLKIEKKEIGQKDHKDFEKLYRIWSNKYFFVSDSEIDIKNYEKIKSKYLGKLIVGNKKLSAQQTVTYNFE